MELQKVAFTVGESSPLFKAELSRIARSLGYRNGAHVVVTYFKGHPSFWRSDPAFPILNRKGI